MGPTANVIQQYAGHRMKMVEELCDRGLRDLQVAEAMSRLPRHLFVLRPFQHKAYGDHPLPIGENQTISQPFVVAAMTEALQLTGEERILEIGTGSGYQTALLAELALQVFTIERIKSLGQTAKRILDSLGYTNINYRVFDGTYGWRDQGPYDGILITAAAPELPRTLIDQVKDGGRIVVPLGGNEGQELAVFTRRGGQLEKRTLVPCNFVPLIGKFGWPEGD